MSLVIAEQNERQLIFGLFKVALSLVIVLIMGAFVVSLFFQNDSQFSSVPFYALIFAIAFSILANGFLAILQVLDWFEKRYERKAAKNG